MTKVIIRLQSRETEASTTASVRKEKAMCDDMNQAEVARDETEKKMIYKFLLMIKDSKDLEELEAKVKALLTE